MSEAVNGLKSSISGMLSTDELGIVSNTSSHHNQSGFQLIQNASVGTDEDPYEESYSSSIGLIFSFRLTVAAVIFVGNLLVVIVISKRKDLQVRKLLCSVKIILVMYR